MEQIPWLDQDYTPRSPHLMVPEEVGQEDWRVNPVYGYGEYLARRPHRPVALANSFTGEVARRLGEDCLPVNSTWQKVKEYMQSKAFDSILLRHGTRLPLSIPATSATSAPSEPFNAPSVSPET
jgi:hypothetical protein